MLLGQLEEPAGQEQILPSQAQRLQGLLVGEVMREEQMEHRILGMEEMVPGERALAARVDLASLFSNILAPAPYQIPLIPWSTQRILPT